MSEADQRREMIEVLGELGVPEAEVPESLADASAMASDVVIARDDEFSLRQLATELGQEVADVADGFRHLGIIVHDPDAVMFCREDVDLARFLATAVADVFNEAEGREILHVAGTALSSIAEASVAGHVQGPERRTANYVENARLNAYIAELGLELSQLLAAAFRHHLRQTAQVQRRTQSSTHREQVTLAVGFLDLVGFTSLSQELDVEELVVFVKAFESRAHELAHDHRARIVKLIGDEVMIVAVDPADAARFVSGMIASLDDDGVVPRGGLAFGELINIHGDYFGPVVNLAARLTDAAVPGEVLVDDAVAQVVASEAAGRRMLKGFDEPIRVHTLLTSELT
ncbi:MAG: adenylate/guanylate cyclase domain-containing protein [Acidimicrobiales bacterium]|nr:adenylate/guanylate cyclase domain-containing protein [Acidimicrobiales bacterium]